MCACRDVRKRCAAVRAVRHFGLSVDVGFAACPANANAHLSAAFLVLQCGRRYNECASTVDLRLVQNSHTKCRIFIFRAALLLPFHRPCRSECGTSQTGWTGCSLHGLKSQSDCDLAHLLDTDFRIFNSPIRILPRKTALRSENMDVFVTRVHGDRIRLVNSERFRFKITDRRSAQERKRYPG